MFKDFVGLQMKFIQGQPATDISMVKDLRLGWVRDTVRWSEIESSVGVYTVPSYFASRLETYRRLGVRVMFILAYGNPIYDNPYDIEAFCRYATYMARYLKQAGVDFVLEILNEPHNFGFKAHYGDEAWIPEYVNLANAVVQAIGAYDASAKVVTNEDMFLLHYQMIDAGLTSAAHGAAVHPYAPMPELAPIDSQTPWMAPYNPAVDNDRYAPSAFEALRGRFPGDPRFYITELGWLQDAEVDEDRVAAYLVRSFVTYYESATVECLLWFSAYDGPDGRMGLVANDGTRRKAYLAFETMMAWLGDANYVTRTRRASRTQGTQSLVFHRKTDEVMVIWYADAGAGRWGTEPIPDAHQMLTVPEDVAAYDMYGARVQDSVVRIGYQPVYLVGRPGALYAV